LGVAGTGRQDTVSTHGDMPGGDTGRPATPGVRIEHERPAPETELHVIALLIVMLQNGQRITVRKWSLAGVRDTALADKDLTSARLFIPLQGIDIAFPVRFALASDGTLWAFDGLTGRQREALGLFYRNLLIGKMAATDVRDATVYTIEVVKGSGLERMVLNFRRWSGNMLRNGARAIALGPRAMPFFLWWCIVDQRIAMWTLMVSPVLAVFAYMIDPIYIWNVLIWIVASRLVLSSIPCTYARRPDLSWPFILYFNQFINSGVKIDMIFHLSKQKWSNRGNQSAGEGTGSRNASRCFNSEPPSPRSLRVWRSIQACSLSRDGYWTRSPSRPWVRHRERVSIRAP
jgi:hypothetical protein